MIDILDRNTGSILPSPDSVYDLAQIEGHCSIHGMEFPASTLVDAITSQGELEFEIEENSSTNSQSFCHEINITEQSETALFGVIQYPLEEPLPTALEICLLRCFLEGYTPASKPHCIKFSVEGEKTDELKLVVLQALSAPGQTTFHRSTESIQKSSLENANVTRITRHLSQSYIHHGTKYGFLELFRAAEACFFAGVFSQIKNEFISKPSATLKKATESMKAENRMVFSVINSVQATGEAESIATIINQLRAAGNSLADELFRAFEKRTDNDKGDKSWRAACYLFNIRCSIAHAGQENIVFEDFSDADDLLDAIYPTFERIILKTLGLSIPDV